NISLSVILSDGLGAPAGCIACNPLSWVKTNQCVSAVCKLACIQRPQGLTETYPQVGKNVIKFKIASPSPPLSTSRAQMFTVSKCFLCEAPAWKH
uniref:Uncharacterized protein n=1 Tax=Equus asinus TaxID=9793 RepID=A0A9L0IJ89_EQUAS